MLGEVAGESTKWLGWLESALVVAPGTLQISGDALRPEKYVATRG